MTETPIRAWVGVSPLPQLLRRPATPRRSGSRTRARSSRPAPTSRAAVGRRTDRGVDADHVAVQVDQRAAGVAGVDRGVGLDRRVRRVLARLRLGALGLPTETGRFSALTMPEVTVASRPNGEPIATTFSPTADLVRLADASPGCRPETPSALITARSVSGSVPTTCAFLADPSLKFTEMVPPWPATDATWLLVRISPSELMMMPEPDPCSLAVADVDLHDRRQHPLRDGLDRVGGRGGLLAVDHRGGRERAPLRGVGAAAAAPRRTRPRRPPPPRRRRPAPPTSRPATTPGPGRPLRRCVRSSGTSGSERKPKPPTCSEVGS